MFDGAEFVGREYKYERRVLRIIVQERLYPLKTLTDIGEIAQVLLDVMCSAYLRLPPCCHHLHWLTQFIGSCTRKSVFYTATQAQPT